MIQTPKESQDEIVAELTARITNLSKNEERLESEENVNELHTNEVDDLQQYQQCQCIIINDLQTAPIKTILQVTQKAEHVLAQHLKLDPDEVENETGKCHPENYLLFPKKSIC